MTTAIQNAENTPVQTRETAKNADAQAESSQSDGSRSYLDVDTDAPITREVVTAVQSIGRKSVNSFTSEDIKKAEPFAHRYWKEMGVKSPFFRAWFGDWRAHDSKTKTGVVDVSKHSEPYKAGNEINLDTNRKMSWGDALKKETWNHGDRTEFSHISVIREIVRNAVLLDTHTTQPDSKTKMPATAFMHSLYSLVADDGEITLYKLFAEEAIPAKGGEPFSRAYELKRVEKVASASSGILLQKKGLTEGAPATTVTVSDLFALVKQFDKSFQPKPVHPALLNEDGTPKVVYHGTDGDFSAFDMSKGRANMDIQGAFFSPWEDDARGYGKNVRAFYLSIRNPASEQTAYKALRMFQGQNEAGKKARQWLESQGYDGVNNEDEEYIAFYPEQIKSATDNIGTFDGREKDIRFHIDERFIPDYDAWDGVSRKRFFVGTTADVMSQFAGGMKKIYWDSNKILEIKKKHPKMTNPIIKQVPKILESPILVMDSKTVDGRIVVFCDVFDKGGNPILAAIELEPTGKDGEIKDFVVIASAYARGEKLAQKYRTEALQEFINTSDIRYVDPNKKRTQAWLKRTRLQLPIGVKFGFNGTVPYSMQNVKNDVQNSQMDGYRSYLDIDAPDNAEASPARLLDLLQQEDSTALMQRIIEEGNRIGWYGLKNPIRMMDAVAGKSKELRDIMQAMFNTPHSNATGKYGRGVTESSLRVDEIVRRYGILEGKNLNERKSAAVQEYGEGYRQKPCKITARMIGADSYQVTAVDEGGKTIVDGVMTFREMRKSFSLQTAQAVRSMADNQKYAEWLMRQKGTSAVETVTLPRKIGNDTDPSRQASHCSQSTVSHAQPSLPFKRTSRCAAAFPTFQHVFRCVCHTDCQMMPTTVYYRQEGNVRILIVEDDKRLADALGQIMTEQKYAVDVVRDGQDGLDYALTGGYDVIVLDIMLPRLDGFAVVKRLRDARVSTPVLMLTARDGTDSKVQGLDCGADDYMTKPFVPEELTARVRALGRRQGDVVLYELTFCDLTLSLSCAELVCGPKRVRLSYKELEVMRLMLSHPHRIVPKEELIVKVWGLDSEAEDNNVEAYISFLRKKMRYLDSAVSIGTIRKVGYRLETEAEA